MNSIPKPFLFFLLVIASFSGFSQTNKKKVLVIPYGRFEFVSEYTLEEIAKKNNITSPEVFNAYQKALLNAFGNFQTENFEFIPATETSFHPYKKYIKYEDGKFKGKSYYALKMRKFPEKEFAQFMEENDASFIIFINWYQIKKATFVSKGKKRTRFKYAGHYVDYDIYNLFQQQIIGVGKEQIALKNPTEKEAIFKALRLKEVREGYQRLVRNIIEVLNNPISE